MLSRPPKPKKELVSRIMQRNCPECQSIIFYTNRRSIELAESKNSLCKPCSKIGTRNPSYGKHPPDAQRAAQSIRQTGGKSPKHSAAMQGVGNSMHGTHFYDVWVKKYGLAVANQKMDNFRAGASRRTLGSGNPNYGKLAAHGSGRGWQGWYKGWYFRSLLELSYVLQLEKNDQKWVGADGQGLRINYTNLKGNANTYVPDFLVENTLVVEVKPTAMMGLPLVKAKASAALAFCATKGLTYQLVDPGQLDKKALHQLYVSGEVRFTPRYEQRYLEQWAAKTPTGDQC